jgi:ATP-binding cassette subfamily B protein
MSIYGVAPEERRDLSKAEVKALRQRSLRLLGTSIRPMRKRVFATMGMVVISTIAQVAGPTLLAIGIDKGLGALTASGDWKPALWIALAYVCLSALGGTMLMLYRRSSTMVSQTVLFDLRARMFEHTQKLGVAFHEKYTSGRVIARQTSDLDTVREFLDGGVSDLVSGTLYMAFTGIALVSLDPQSFLPILFAFIPLFFFGRWFATQSRLAFREARIWSARLIVQFVETMTGIRAVKAFRREERNDERYSASAIKYRNANRRVIGLFGTFDPGLRLIGNFTMVVVLVLGAFRVVNGTMAIGVLLAVVLYSRRFFDPVQNLTMFFNSLQNASSALEKISGVLEEDPSVVEPSNPTPLPHAGGTLTFDHVSFAYAGNEPVFKNLDITIPGGQTVALIGTTGAGKSTMAKLIARFYDPTSGTVTLDGVDLRNAANADLRQAVVMVTQEAYIFSGSIADNIEIGKPGATFDEIVAAARAVGAHEFISSLPEGYETDVNKRGGRLSAGQRQLVSFARAFIADPSVVILDEATASLDIPSERLVQQGLTTLLADRTAIIIAHRLSTVSIADRVLVMEHGQVIEDGTPTELIAHEGKFADLHAAWRSSLA